MIIHQLTDLPKGLDPALMGEFTARNARIREEGTRNLVEACRKTKVRRIIAQSIAASPAHETWAYGFTSAPAHTTGKELASIQVEGSGPVIGREAALGTDAPFGITLVSRMPADDGAAAAAIVPVPPDSDFSKAPPDCRVRIGEIAAALAWRVSIAGTKRFQKAYNPTYRYEIDIRFDDT